MKNNETNKLFTVEEAREKYNKNQEQEYRLSVACEKKAEELKVFRNNIDPSLELKRKEIKIQIGKLKITKAALKTNTEFKKAQIAKKRKEISVEISKLCKELDSLNASIVEHSKDKPENFEVELNRLSKEYNIALNEYKNFVASTKDENKVYYRIIKKDNVKNRKADEKIKIEKLKDNNQDGQAKTEISSYKKIYREKCNNTLEFIPNTMSYGFALLVVLLEVIYTIMMLNGMKTNYLVMPLMLINIAFLLLLFLAALKIKNYSKNWTFFMVGFACYMFIRMFVIVPFVIGGEEYSSLRIKVIVLSLVIVILSGYLSYISITRINNRTRIMKRVK